MADKLEVGQMNRKITIQQSTETKSPGGTALDTWSNVCTVYASRTPVSESSEKFINNRFVSAPVYKYKIHYRPNITEEMRIVDSNVNYNILFADPSDDKSHLILIAERLTD